MSRILSSEKIIDGGGLNSRNYYKEGQTQMKNGKIILIFIIALIMTTAAQAQERINQSPDKMEGSWKVIVVPGQSPIPLPPFVEAIVTYIPGGGLIESDNLAVPNSIAGTGQGTWEAVNSRLSRQFDLTFTKYLFSTQGLLLGSVRVTERIALDSNDNEYRGEGRLEILTPTGAVLFTIPATSTATRIRARQAISENF
jgi:hypothetical protein